MLSVIYADCYAECHMKVPYADWRQVECRYAE